MTDPRLRSILLATCLIGGGVLLLLVNFGVLDAYAPWPQVGLAAVGVVAALGFFASFARNRSEWWRLMPAWTLIALAAMSLISVFPAVDPRWIAAMVFLGLAAAFGHIYLLARAERWWAIIPGGFMLVIGLVVGISSQVPSNELLASLLFVGLGGVFFVLYALGGRRRPWWALIPGSVLVIFGLLVLTAGREGQNDLLRWWPLALIVLGLAVAVSARRISPAEKLAVNTAPKTPVRPAAKGQGAPVKPSAAPATRGQLGEYSQPAPGTSVEVLVDLDE